VDIAVRHLRRIDDGFLERELAFHRLLRMKGLTDNDCWVGPGHRVEVNHAKTYRTAVDVQSQVEEHRWKEVEHNIIVYNGEENHT